MSGLTSSQMTPISPTHFQSSRDAGSSTQSSHALPR
ncbi:hypothetical protein E2C01_094248 [Portunus trituberculatus]|uniref:Uncharacterized protein n=1 Tax=Portunus trituberculatus TaxID=210409 RepID=A0A5B7JWN6_PORTR|nr:hypothetical protein [Portunus trituberculatus]